METLNYIDFSKRIKDKYPEYQDIDDKTLSKMVVDKYPEYQSIVTFDEPESDYNIPQWKLDEMRNNYTINFENFQDFDKEYLKKHYKINIDEVLKETVKSDTGFDEDYLNASNYLRNVNTVDRVMFPEQVTEQLIADGYIKPPEEKIPYQRKAETMDYVKSFFQSMENIMADIGVTSFDLTTKPQIIDKDKGFFSKFINTILTLQSGKIPVYSEEEKQSILEAKPEARELIRKDIESILPKSTERSLERVQEDLDSNELPFLINGMAMIASQGGNLIAGRANPILGYISMASTERESMLKQLMNTGIPYEDAQKWANLYGSVSGVIEYAEMAGRLRGAGLRGKTTELSSNKILKIAGRMLKEGGLNVSEELLQSGFDVFVYNKAIEEYNLKNPDGKQLERKEFEGARKIIKDSLSMSTVLDMLGLGTQGVKTVSDVGSVKSNKMKLLRTLHLPKEVENQVKESLKEVKTPEELQAWYDNTMTLLGNNNIRGEALVDTGNGYSLADLINAYVANDPKNTMRNIKKAMEEGGVKLDALKASIAKFEAGWDGTIPGHKKDDRISTNEILQNLANEMVTSTDQSLMNEVLDLSERPMTKGQFKLLNDTRTDLVVALKALNEETSYLLSRALQGDEKAQELWNTIAKTKKIRKKVREQGIESLSPNETAAYINARDQLETYKRKEKPFQERTVEELLNVPNNEITDEARDKLERIGTLGGSAFRGIVRNFVSISTRIKEINEGIALKTTLARMEASKFEQEFARKTLFFGNRLADIRKKLKRNKDEYNKFKAEVLNADWNALKERGFTDQEISDIKSTLEMIADAYQLENRRNNYFPRTISDKNYSKLLNYLGRRKIPPLEKRLKQKAEEKGSALTDIEKNKVIRDYLFLSLRAKPVQARTMGDLTPEMAEFYDDPLDSLARYFSKMSREIARKKYLDISLTDPNENWDGIEEPDISIDNLMTFIRKNVEQGELLESEQRELAALLKSDLTQQSTPRLIENIRALSSIKYASGPTTWISQLADLIVTIGENGIDNVIPVIFGGKVNSIEELRKMSEKELTDLYLQNLDKRDPEKFALDKELLKKNAKGIVKMLRQTYPELRVIGINELDAELQDTKKSLLGKITEGVFLPLQVFDKFGKGTLIRSTALKWENMVKDENGNFDEGRWYDLEEELRSKGIVDDYMLDQIRTTLRTGNMTVGMELALYNQMKDFHPINHSEHIKMYIDHPSLRFAFILRSFALKRFDRFYREAMAPFMDGIVQIRQGLILGDSVLTQQGFDNLFLGKKMYMRFLFYTIAGDAFINVLKDMLKDLAGDDERAKKYIDNWDEVVGTFSKEYLEQFVGVFPYFNYYAIEQAWEREQPWYAFTKTFEIPKPWGVDTLGYAIDKAKGEESDAWKNDVLYIGPYMDGVQRFIDKIE